MLPVSQILERNIALFNSEHWLVVNPGEATWLNLCPSANMDVLHQYLDVFQACTGFSGALEFDSRDVVADDAKLHFEIKNGSHNHIFAPFIKGKKYDNVLIVMPKAKAQLAFLIDMACASLNEEGCVYVVGENRSGIKSINKVLAKRGTVTKVDSARHCTLLSFVPEQQFPLFNPAKYLSVNTYTLNAHEWFCASFPGVFSDGELDEGTRLMLNTLPYPVHGYSLDFACGAGVIAGCLMSQLKHLKVDLSDVSAIALYASAHTLQENQSHGTLIAANGLKGIKRQYQNVITNPPFHTGIRTDYQIVTDFVSVVGDSLKKGGKLFVVANRFLPYMEQLQQQFKQVDVLAQDTRFSVYSSS